MRRTRYWASMKRDHRKPRKRTAKHARNYKPYPMKSRETLQIGRQRLLIRKLRAENEQIKAELRDSKRAHSDCLKLMRALRGPLL